MVTSILYFFIVFGLMAGVAWMIGHTLRILFGADASESIPSRHFDGPVAG